MSKYQSFVEENQQLISNLQFEEEEEVFVEVEYYEYEEEEEKNPIPEIESVSEKAPTVSAQSYKSYMSHHSDYLQKQKEKFLNKIRHEDDLMRAEKRELRMIKMLQIRSKDFSFPEDITRRTLSIPQSQNYEYEPPTATVMSKSTFERLIKPIKRRQENVEIKTISQNEFQEFIDRQNLSNHRKVVPPNQKPSPRKHSKEHSEFLFRSSVKHEPNVVSKETKRIKKMRPGLINPERKIQPKMIVESKKFCSEKSLELTRGKPSLMDRSKIDYIDILMKYETPKIL